MARRSVPDLAARALPGAEFALRVTPRASRNALTEDDGQLRCQVTAVPEDGRANAAVTELLAAALGVAKSRLTLVRGATARDKLFRLD
ncbi:MAG: hypothetical protein BGP11_15570 [Rhodobacterales bacterium 65-51]|jgi:uncharacterized protein YggU (UPF0235/DUF167 family)|uniref:UPF0235 protein GCM10007291_10620 n=1 Tax=Gemmobacter nanjingensis TaxID=488454 RepID=A0ABQ3F967_9RHOB|nr:DUF167 domain-containing protein [Gemmobacter nanjingensis]OJY27477.1 MAG: hypothetical protein BGP11_15570 [Rhodobacterales bacterium 65-51]GHC14725.1 UPF0235 protein [Gemmobacter nanjingensis]